MPIIENTFSVFPDTTSPPNAPTSATGSEKRTARGCVHDFVERDEQHVHQQNRQGQRAAKRERRVLSCCAWPPNTTRYPGGNVVFANARFIS